MDAFYASVEVLRRPKLRGLPVVVGGSGRRGVVATASYEARFFGVRSAMPSVQAQRLCPDAVFLSGDLRHYAAISERVMGILRDITPLVEPLSLDEAFCDVRGVARLKGAAPKLAAEIRAKVLQREQLTCSVGVASSKFLAKLATEQAKPKATPSGPLFGSGIHVVEAGTELDFLHPLPIRALFGIGRATAQRLGTLGVRTVGDLAALRESTVTRTLGTALGRHLHLLARGIDDRPVVTHRNAKSIGHEQTFSHDLHDRADLYVEIARLSDAVARRMRSADVKARTITIKVRFGDFSTITRSLSLPKPINGSREVTDVAKGLLDQVDRTDGVRLLGVSGSGLMSTADSDLDDGQLSLFHNDDADDACQETANNTRWRAAEQAMDHIRDRFGPSSIGAAAQVGPDRLMRPGETDPRPWGPSHPSS